MPSQISKDKTHRLICVQISKDKTPLICSGGITELIIIGLLNYYAVVSHLSGNEGVCFSFSVDPFMVTHLSQN